MIRHLKDIKESVSRHRSRSRGQAPSQETQNDDAASPPPPALSKRAHADSNIDHRELAPSSGAHVSVPTLPKLVLEASPGKTVTLNTSAQDAPDKKIELESLEPTQDARTLHRRSDAANDPAHLNMNSGVAETSDQNSKSFWDHAHEELEKSEKDLMNKYWAVLSKELAMPDTPANSSEGQPPNQVGDVLNDKESIIPSDPSERAAKMMTILQRAMDRGLKRMDRKHTDYTIAGHTFNFSDQVDQVAKFILWGKSLVDEAVKPSPEASMAWCGVCLALPLVTRSSETSATHREAFTYVTSRMQFYIQLEPVLFPKAQDPVSTIPQSFIVDLYKHILQFQIHSVLRFFRNRFKTYGHDLMQREDWKGMLEGIQKLEKTLDSDLDKISSATRTVELQALNKSTKDLVGTTNRLLSVAEEQLAVTSETRDLTKEIVELQKESKYKLPVAKTAILTSTAVGQIAMCHEGTRSTIRRRLTGWIHDDVSQGMIWLNGHAGTGKSTIARTLAKRFAAERRLAAGFFFKRKDKLRNGSSRLFSTIAAQLMVTVPGFKACLGESKGDMSQEQIEALDLEEQFNLLIATPLSEISSEESNTSDINATLLIVVDALDECIKRGDDQDESDDTSQILQLLADMQSTATLRLCILVTSRPTRKIEDQFSALKKEQIPYRSLSLLDEEFAKETADDINIFLRDTLAVIKEGNRHIRSAWPSEEDVIAATVLCTTPKPLFIYASTLCAYVGGKGSPVRRLADWLQRSSNDVSRLDEKLDEMYQIVLDEVWGSTKDSARDLSSTEKELLTDLLRSIVLLESPLPAERLIELLDKDPSDAVLLENLAAVLNIPHDDEAPVEIIHKSFSDFLQRQKASTTDGFRMDVAETHAMLASKCLERMRKESGGLRKDLCQLADPAKHPDEIDDTVINDAIPPELKYAILSWAYHACQWARLGIDKSRSKELIRQDALEFFQDVQTFMQEHFLYWLEALSILRSVPASILTMANMLSLLAVGSLIILIPDSPPFRLIEDAYRFLLASRRAIEQAPLQAYASALVFSPSSSLIRQLFSGEYLGWISTKPLVEQSWGAFVQTLYSKGDDMNCIAFSKAGYLVAAPVRKGVVKVWDLHSGVCRQTLDFDFKSDYSHAANFVSSIVFSADDQRLACVSIRGDAKVLHLSSGDCLESFEKQPHTSWLAFSDDTQWIASKDSSGEKEMIYVNDVTRGRRLKRLQFHEKHHGLETAIFSRDRTRLAATTFSTIVIWDIDSESCLRTIDSVFSYGILAFSPGGAEIAAPSHRTLGIWSVKGSDSHELTGASSGRISAITYLSDGKLAFGEDDTSIRIWDPKSGKPPEKFIGHRDSVQGIASSSNGMELVSCDGVTIRSWNLNTEAGSHDIESHDSPVRAIALLPNGRQAVSGSENRIIKIWDVSSGTLWKTITDHSDEFDRFVFSSNGERMASVPALSSRTFTVWDANTFSSIQKVDQSFKPDFITLSSDGRYLALCAHKNVYVVDVSSNDTIQSFLCNGSVTMMAFSEDGQKLATGGRSRAEVWDIKSGNRVARLRVNQETAEDIAFLENDQQLAIHCNRRLLMIMDIKSGHKLKQIDLDNEVSYTSVDARGTRVFTPNGTICHLPYSEATPAPARYLGYGVTQDVEWITYNGQKVLWLPDEYRGRWTSGNYVAVGLDTIVLGCLSGRVSIFGFSQESFPW